MSGHSKWATIKHKKAAVDKVRGKTFAKLSRLLEVAAREGGGDPATNASLRTVVAKAKAASMTNDAIDRAIKRGTGETDGEAYEAVTYEAYGPGGVAMLIEILTDNRNRTAADVRMIFSKQGGSMAAPGSVAWQFSRKGVLLVPKSTSEEVDRQPQSNRGRCAHDFFEARWLDGGSRVGGVAVFAQRRFARTQVDERGRVDDSRARARFRRCFARR